MKCRFPIPFLLAAVFPVGTNDIRLFFRLWEADFSSNVIADPLVIPEPAGTSMGGTLLLLCSGAIVPGAKRTRKTPDASALASVV